MVEKKKEKKNWVRPCGTSCGVVCCCCCFVGDGGGSKGRKSFSSCWGLPNQHWYHYRGEARTLPVATLMAVSHGEGVDIWGLL